MKKQVKIIGLSVNKDFGGLKATELTFDENNKLTLVKGEVGSGKTTLNRALSLTTKGSKTLEDNNLYGEIDLTAQLLDGEHKVFIDCKGTEGNLKHTIYTIDKDGNKLKDVVIDGKKLTPANYLSSLQTSLTWRLDELTSENPTTQRNILLELYQNELEQRGVFFDKNNPKYVGGIIDKIEKAKNDRNYADMKRKEVGGIGDDLRMKGINSDQRRELKSEAVTVALANDLSAQITLAKTNITQQRESQLNALKAKGSEINGRLRDINDGFKAVNSKVDVFEIEYKAKKKELNIKVSNIEDILLDIFKNESAIVQSLMNQINNSLPEIKQPTETKVKELQFSEKGQCISKPEDFDKDTSDLLTEYRSTATEYIRINNLPLTVADTTEIENKLDEVNKELKSIRIWNKEAIAINALHDWKDKNEDVKDLQNDFYMKLTEIETGVKGLHIAPESKESQNIYLMYDGSYDTDYFHNPNKELRKLSAYSDTQKPLICLLIQQYMLSKKGKTLPYLWIDKVPIDNKTRELLEKMSNDLDLWLFVSWTGDFKLENLKDGELLLEGGEVFFNGKNI